VIWGIGFGPVHGTMKAALIGLPQSGKSTLFAAVTGASLDSYAAPEPHHAVVRVPDPRLAYLAELAHPKKVTEATIEFIDVPGCSLDDAKGREEWRRLLPVVRQSDVLVLVVRDFENPTVPACRERIDAKADFDAVWEEILFADLETVSTRIERLEAALKKPTKTHEAEKHELALMARCREALESEEALLSVITAEEDRRQLSSFAFLTEKPLVGVANVSDDRAADRPEWDVPHVEDVITLCASIEAEIAVLDEEDRPAFLADLGIDEPARGRLMKTCYHAAGLISFLTMNAEEARAWTIHRGATALEAAAKVHTDLARGFIRAETVSYDDLVAHKDMKGARAAGRVRKEGKTYVVQDGDVLQILSSA
jgi:GTP-binding protein YchF